MDRFEKIVSYLSRKIALAGYFAIIMMMALTVFDVTGRYFGHPIKGAEEIVSWALLITVASPIAFTYLGKGQISVEFLTSKLPPKTQAIIDVIVSIVSIAFFSILAWRSIAYATERLAYGDESWVLRWPHYPFIYLLALFCLPVIAVLVLNLCKSIMKAIK